MAEKRPYTNDGILQNDNKRSRSAAGSPAPISSTNGAAPINIADQIAAAKARAAAVRERLSNMNKSGSPAPVASTSGPSTQSPAEAARAKIEAMKARVAAATAKSSAAAPPPRTASPMPAYQPPPADVEDGFTRARGGLGIGLHPSLMVDSTLDNRNRKSAIQPKFGTTIGNRRAESPVFAKGKQLDLVAPTLEELKKNPYFDIAVLPPKARKSRDLLFHQKGKFIAQAAALRRQAQLEDMKRRIAESARKAGLDEDRSEQAFLVAKPPDVEWWDEGLLVGDTYPDFSTLNEESAEKLCKITTEDSVITRYVQHPVLLTPPQEKTLFVPKPLPLTKTEQAKKRRQDRMERLKEQQAKVRLGLEPPEPPKIKKSNLMRVLGEQAVKDPTAVEARVNREIEERRAKHEATNEERALTKEQRAEKLAAQQAADAAKGLQVNVYRIDSLASGKHRYQIDVNAKQHALTGITILHPKCNLVVVEGGAHSIAKYQHLMLKRIPWTENSAPLAMDDDNKKGTKPGGGKDPITEATWLRPEDEATGELKDLSDNQCILVWEGEIRQRMFKKWGSRVCETDGQARSALERAKAEFYWTKARGMPRA